MHTSPYPILTNFYLFILATLVCRCLCNLYLATRSLSSRVTQTASVSREMTEFGCVGESFYFCHVLSGSKKENKMRVCVKEKIVVSCFRPFLGKWWHVHDFYRRIQAHRDVCVVDTRPCGVVRRASSCTRPMHQSITVALETSFACDRHR